MGSEDVITALRRVPLFSRLTDEQLQWMAQHGRQLRFAAGSRVAIQGDRADGLSVILDGRTEWTRRVGEQDAPVATLGAGELFGELILFLNAPYPSTGVAATDVRLFRLEPATFWELLRVAPVLSRGLMELASQRQQPHETSSKQQPELLSAGQLTAGLAGELENPAASSRRSAARLRDTLRVVSARAMALGEHGLSPAQRMALLALPREAAERGRTSPLLEPVARAEREEALGTWLESRGVAEAWEAAPVLVASGLDVAWLESVSTRVGEALLGDVLGWLVAAVTCDVLLAEVERGTARVSTLAEAMKAYSFLDALPMQEGDLHEGLERTLSVLSHRLSDRITVERQYDRSLPPFTAEDGALEEVWTQLVLNALQALGERGGRLRLRTWAENGRAVVEVADDGPGIPKDLMPRVFEPFFSTRPHAAGLGLDVCRRIVERHGGELRVLSEPGGTRVQVRLPV
ncbi:cyclic nucleotide-binding domain-containing protein [Pyxidicoccus parkwayensis]|uniref:histidine kinase n=1 Tax=Pyxidicoccus parkwayensis TaxID=2813578 RepID=A0ABX7NUJ7_9BACT|nr:cyclic nucleotide-binding domain-containing protein [Pyxidicoccus parkwaysis]QSQ22575.1 cyclic nucleotide-binding domain-containing protein [Pyxidicoccus parkwaysis]